MKSKQEVELDSLLDDYYNVFGENYPLCISSLMSTDEIMEDIREHIRKGEPKPEPDYDEDCNY